MLRGIELADSLAFDWHKWGQVLYDCGFLLVRDGACIGDVRSRRRLFAPGGARAGRWRLVAVRLWAGPVAGVPRAEDLVHLKTYGADAIGRDHSETVSLAARLGRAGDRASRNWSCWAPVPLNIVCFGYRGPDANRLNAEIVADLHEAGRVAPSLTTIGGRTAIRAAIVNHRTAVEDVDALVASVLAVGRRRRRGAPRDGTPDGPPDGTPDGAALTKSRGTAGRNHWRAAWLD